MQGTEPTRRRGGHGPQRKSGGAGAEQVRLPRVPFATTHLLVAKSAQGLHDFGCRKRTADISPTCFHALSITHLARTQPWAGRHRPDRRRETQFSFLRTELQAQHFVALGVVWVGVQFAGKEMGEKMIPLKMPKNVYIYII